jgi:uncharacterized membrane protein
VAERRNRLDQPKSPSRSLRPSYDPEAFGRSTERIARFLGTGRYLVIQSVIIIAWILINTIPGLPHFDPYQFLFLTLVLSLQAAYSAPLILLAQNRQDDRDRVNLDQDRDQDRQSKADLQYLARELASVRIALGEVVTRDFLRAELARGDGKDARKPRDKKPRDPKPAGSRSVPRSDASEQP